VHRIPAATDPRVRGTVEAIQQHLTVDGLVLRYRTRPKLDGLPPGEGVFLACSFWLADAYACSGAATRRARCSSGSRRSATTWGCSPRNIDPCSGASLGNFPQAFRTSRW
jgi:GH15 family glucan-1,4-alpha-glucosidase